MDLMERRALLFMAQAKQIASGIYTQESTETGYITINHGLGAVPDFVLCLTEQEPENRSTNYVVYGFIAYKKQGEWEIWTLQYSTKTAENPTSLKLTNETLLSLWENALTASAFQFARPNTSYAIDQGFKFRWVVGKY